VSFLTIPNNTTIDDWILGKRRRDEVKRLVRPYSKCFYVPEEKYATESRQLTKYNTRRR
jgi:hypothetical protein